MLNNESRRIVLDLAVSLDGFIEDMNGETGWCVMDEEMDFTKFLRSVDTILYGRKSYDLWGEYPFILRSSITTQSYRFTN